MSLTKNLKVGAWGMPQQRDRNPKEAERALNSPCTTGSDYVKEVTPGQPYECIRGQVKSRLTSRKGSGWTGVRPAENGQVYKPLPVRHRIVVIWHR
jgi:hypothetical protein